MSKDSQKPDTQMTDTQMTDEKIAELNAKLQGITTDSPQDPSSTPNDLKNTSDLPYPESGQHEQNQPELSLSTDTQMADEKIADEKIAELNAKLQNITMDSVQAPVSTVDSVESINESASFESAQLEKKPSEFTQSEEILIQDDVSQNFESQAEALSDNGVSDAINTSVTEGFKREEVEVKEVINETLDLSTEKSDTEKTDTNGSDLDTPNVSNTQSSAEEVETLTDSPSAESTSPEITQIDYSLATDETQAKATQSPAESTQENALPFVDNNIHAVDTPLPMPNTETAQTLPHSELDGEKPSEQEIPAPQVIPNEEHNKDTEFDEALAFPPTQEHEQEEKEELPPPPPQKVSFAQKIFAGCSYIALPLLLLLTLGLCAQQFFFPRDFWISEEVRLADVYMNMQSAGFSFKSFLQVSLNGEYFFHIGPLYFSLIWLFDAIPQINMPQAFFGANIVFSCFFILSTWLLARALQFNRQIAFAAGLITLSSIGFLGLSHYIQPLLVFSTFMNMAFLCFYRGWQKENGFFWLSFAFIFLACATFISAILSLALPVLAAIFYLTWTGKWKRLNGGDGIFGFLVYLTLIFIYLAYFYLTGQEEYLITLIQEYSIAPLSLDTYPSSTFLKSLALLPILAMPWMLAILFVNWIKVIINIPKSVKARKEKPAASWLVCLILSGIILFSLIKDNETFYLLCLLPALSILLAKAILNFSATSSRFFFGLMAMGLFLAGILAIMVEFHAYIFPYLPTSAFIPKEIPAFISVATTDTDFGLSALGGSLILFSIVLFSFTKRQFAGGASLILSLAFIISSQPFSLMVAPQLDILFSPKTQGEIFATHKAQGYEPASFGVYPHIYTYHYNTALAEQGSKKDGNTATYGNEKITHLNSQAELNTFISSNPKVILAIPVELWNALPQKQYSTLLQNQWLENKDIALTLWEAPQLEVDPPTVQEPAGEQIEEQTGEEAQEVPLTELGPSLESSEETTANEQVVPSETTQATESVEGSAPSEESISTEAPSETLSNEQTDAQPEAQAEAQTEIQAEENQPSAETASSPQESTDTPKTLPQVDKDLQDSMENTLLPQADVKEAQDSPEVMVSPEITTPQEVPSVDAPSVDAPSDEETPSNT